MNNLINTMANLHTNKEELYVQCLDVLESDEKVSPETMDAICEFILHCVQKYNLQFNLDCIKNQEVKERLGQQLN